MDGTGVRPVPVKTMVEDFQPGTKYPAGILVGLYQFIILLICHHTDPRILSQSDCRFGQLPLLSSIPINCEHSVMVFYRNYKLPAFLSKALPHRSENR